MRQRAHFATHDRERVERIRQLHGNCYAGCETKQLLEVIDRLVTEPLTKIGREQRSMELRNRKKAPKP